MVTDADLNDFASDRSNCELRLKTIDVGAFSGFYAERIEKGVFWREWWLRQGYLLVYGSYNVEERFKDAENLVVDRIIGSLKPK